jgi:hypothetical protein
LPASPGPRTALGQGIDVRGPGQRSGGYLIELPDWIADRLTVLPV